MLILGLGFAMLGLFGIRWFYKVYRVAGGRRVANSALEPVIAMVFIGLGVAGAVILKDTLKDIFFGP